MREYDVQKTQFTIGDFLSWQRDGSLCLNPPFQRRSVWKPDAKSYFIDTVVKGLPAPIIYLRQRVELENQKTIRVVVDGQQRLRTVFAYIDPGLLKDYDSRRDGFTVKSVHNEELAGKPYARIPRQLKERLLSYQFSTHVLPIDVEDQEILEMFARLNATGVKLTAQELRNAEFFGEYKTSMYKLAFEQLNRWRSWGIFSDNQIARMDEVEATSDLVMNMIQGLTNKSKKRIDDIYKEYDATFKARAEVERRFRQTMDEIDALLGPVLAHTVYHSAVHFFSLFVLIYDVTYGLGSSLGRTQRRRVPSRFRQRLGVISHRFSGLDVPEDVLDAVRRASADLGRRQTRLRYMKQVCGNA